MRKLYGLLLGMVLLAAGAIASAEPVDINSATAEELSAAMKDVGKVKAAAIIEEREKNGPFKSIDDLTRVKGIKGATINKNRDTIMVGNAPPAATAKGMETAAATKATAALPPK